MDKEAQCRRTYLSRNNRLHQDDARVDSKHHPSNLASMTISSRARKDRYQELEVLLQESLSVYRTEPLRSIELALKARDLSEELTDLRGLSRAHYRIGCAKRELAEYLVALDHLDLSLSAAAKSSDLRQRSAALHIKGSVLCHLGRFNEAQVSLEEAAAIRRKLGLLEQTSDVLTDLATLHFRQGDYASALEALFNAIKLLEGKNEPLRMAILLSVVSSIYSEANYDEKAEQYLDYALVHAEASGDAKQELVLRLKRYALKAPELDATSQGEELAYPQSLSDGIEAPDLAIEIQLHYAEYQLKSGNSSEALTILNTASEGADRLRMRLKQIEAAMLMAEAYISVNNDFGAAETLLKHALEMSSESGCLRHAAEASSRLGFLYRDQGDSVRGLEFILLERSFISQFNVEKQQRAVSNLQARVELERADRERERLASLNAQLQREKESNSMQMASLALHLVHKNEFLAEIRESVQHTPNSDELIKRINEHVRGDADWQLFEEQLNSSQSDFLTTLASRFSGLSAMERKVAVLMRMNLSTKAIANLLCISVRTVENHRLGLRRKMGLSAEVNLGSYLLTL